MTYDWSYFFLVPLFHSPGRQYQPLIKVGNWLEQDDDLLDCQRVSIISKHGSSDSIVVELDLCLLRLGQRYVPASSSKHREQEQQQQQQEQ